MGKGVTPDADKKRILGTEVRRFVWPAFTVRPPTPHPADYLRRYPWANATDIGLTRFGVARGDYAILPAMTSVESVADTTAISTFVPPTYAKADSDGQFQEDRDRPVQQSQAFNAAKSLAKVEDGTSQTYMMGEKYIDPAMYESGEDYGDEPPITRCRPGHSTLVRTRARPRSIGVRVARYLG